MELDIGEFARCSSNKLPGFQSGHRCFRIRVGRTRGRMHKFVWWETESDCQHVCVLVQQNPRARWTHPKHTLVWLELGKTVGIAQDTKGRQRGRDNGGRRWGGISASDDRSRSFPSSGMCDCERRERITHHDQTSRCQTRSLALTGNIRTCPFAATGI